MWTASNLDHIFLSQLQEAGGYPWLELNHWPSQSYVIQECKDSVFMPTLYAWFVDILEDDAFHIEHFPQL